MKTLVYSDTLGYDDKDASSIAKYSKKLINKTFREILQDDCVREKNKGNLGQIIEEHFFHYKCNNSSEPDFPEAKVELKVTPYKENKNGSISAKERLSLTMIDYNEIVSVDFEESHLWKKCRQLLLIFYLYDKSKNAFDNVIKYSELFTPSEQDLSIIRQDYKIIADKVKKGKAHELSEGDTLYLGAATKSATSEDRRRQPNSDELAKPRVFSFKNSYMSYVLNNYIVNKAVDDNRDKSQSILNGELVDSLETYVLSKIEKERGKAASVIEKECKISFKKKPKNYYSMLAYRILGVRTENAEEFEKAGVQVKAIRVEENGSIKECISFPAFDFSEFAQEKWEESEVYNLFDKTKFLFIIYKYKDGDYVLEGAKFWNMPFDDLNFTVKQEWQAIHDIISNGVLLENDKNGIVRNNLPGIKNSKIIHVRPHADKAAYKLKNGFEKGNIEKDACMLPNGEWMTKQCFWINNSYIAEQLDI